MAVIKIWKIDQRLDNVIGYATKDEKFDINSYLGLNKVIKYSTQDYKTEKQMYVSGINCSPDIAFKEMIITKKAFHKENGIQGFHIIQSFKPGEVTPELCHEVGMKFAEEVWGDRFEVVVSTHMDKHHLHNHFVMNSVSFIDGKKYQDNNKTYADLRSVSDSLCEEYGLSVIKQKSIPKYKKNYSNYQKANYQNNNYYSTAKKDIDRAIGMASSYLDFENLLVAMGYEIKHRGRNKVLTIRREPYKKNIRVYNYGEDYTTERITERVRTEMITRVPFLNEFNNNKYYRDYNYKYEKPKGIYALILHYCYLLNVFPKKNPYKKIPPGIRSDSLKLDKISEEAKLLVSENLETDEQFFLFKNNKQNELNALLDEREKLWYRFHHSENQNKIKIEIDSIKPKVEELRRVIKLCDGIEERIPKVERNIEKLIEERKESERNEHIK